ncbi:hypothetical protein M5D96_009632 [Drosophila gunungcola]|uniref:Uncharacterized protein n=1 Tax=Drosophila gunungcola TaxID=103775 RepID=A0A9P9YI88_9MUSC|nr:hypothetical protein M5D96_009632 [Drosophila gunungcola]
MPDYLTTRPLFSGFHVSTRLYGQHLTLFALPLRSRSRLRVRKKDRVPHPPTITHSPKDLARFARCICSFRHEHRHGPRKGQKEPSGTVTLRNQDEKLSIGLAIHPILNSNPIPSRTHSPKPSSTVTTVDVDRECFREAAKPQGLSHSKWGLCA